MNPNDQSQNPGMGGMQAPAADQAPVVNPNPAPEPTAPVVPPVQAPETPAPSPMGDPAAQTPVAPVPGVPATDNNQGNPTA
ncbi:MAG: hypothetical protein HZC02_01220 [Candidatus Levybacteria bacterium]|nr:hypothetical protein [Candidatus Levybacteria bacterium]